MIRHQLSPQLLILGAATAVLLDAMLNVQTLGLGVFIAAALLAAATLLATSRWRPDLTARIAGSLAVAVLFSAGFLWRDSEMLQLLDLAIILGALLVATFPAHAVAITASGLVKSVLTALFAGVETLVGFLLAMGEVDWKELTATNRSQRVMPIVRGTLIAFPLLLIFGGLFIAADARFEALIGQLFNFNAEWIVIHGVSTAFLSYLTIGFLRTALYGEFPAVPEGDLPRLGRTEIVIILSALNALFALFVATQFRYLFGGAATLASAAGLTAAEYARRGFFELVTVVALVLPLLLFFAWSIAQLESERRRLVLSLMLLQIGLTIVIALSAGNRMVLYAREFGLTEARVYASAFMVWLVCAIVIFAVTLLFAKSERFVIAASFAALAVVATLHAINPDDLIVRVNAQRASEGVRVFDSVYVAGLSGDATPSILNNWLLLPKEARHMIAVRLMQRETHRQKEDWRSWNYSRGMASKFVERHRSHLAIESTTTPMRRR